MATIENRGQYQYRAKVRKRGVSLSETFESREAAEAWAAEREAEILANPDKYRSEHERQQHAKTITVTDILEKYRDEVTIAKKGVKTETVAINAMLRMPIAMITVADLSTSSVNDYISLRLKKTVNGKQLSGDTVNRDLNILSNAFNVACKRWNWPVVNPIPGIERPKNGKHRTRRFESNEEERLMIACRQARNNWLPVIVELAFESAMRRSELLAMCWQQVDFQRHTIHIPDTKNHKARTVPMTVRASQVLSKWKEKTNQKGAVFKDVTIDALKMSYGRARKRANIEGLRFHDLRHEATSRYFEVHGLDLIEVMSATGHSHATMTERYTHLNAQKISNKLRGGRIQIELADEDRKKLSKFAEKNGYSLKEAATVKLLEAIDKIR